MDGTFNMMDCRDLIPEERLGRLQDIADREGVTLDDVAREAVIQEMAGHAGETSLQDF